MLKKEDTRTYGRNEVKKILLGAVLASGLAMSGDLVKYSEAFEMRNKYSTLSVQEAEGSLMQRAYQELFHEWDKVSKNECKGIFGKKTHVQFFGF